MATHTTKALFRNLSIEEENLASIPFAVLERRVGKRVNKVEIRGTKVLADGTEVKVLWQVQGNDELGLPTEQDLDLFVALGVLTFRKNLSKTVSFTGREIGRIINLSGVHGKFYQRLKMAMDRFIPLRFRAITASDRQEDVKWLNVFQEASFSLDRETGRCVGSVTWTDKLIQSMENGFFRLLDASRYMELDGLTAKHLYRHLTIAFEKTDVVVMDARSLATEHLGIFKLPAYLSRLLQTLEPAFDQLIHIRVLGSYHVVDPGEWKIALHRHADYVPERKQLLAPPVGSIDSLRQSCFERMTLAGLDEDLAKQYCEGASGARELFQIQRAARVLDELKSEGVLAHVALDTVRRTLELGPASEEAREALDWCDIALEVCRQKRKSGQALRNAPGLLIKIIKDPEARERIVSASLAEEHKRRFRAAENAAVQQLDQAQERTLILQYEEHRQNLAREAYEQLTDAARASLRKEKVEWFRQHRRLDRMPVEVRDSEVVEAILQDLAKKVGPPFERWLLRRNVRQANLPFMDGLDSLMEEGSKLVVGA